jgi:uncharacterized protein (UPF0261 family)
MPTAILVGTLDTKGREYDFVRGRLAAMGIETIVVDVGVLGDPGIKPDVAATDVAVAAGETLPDLRAAADRGAANSAMSRGAALIVGDLVTQGKAHGVIGLGGTGGTTLISYVMRALPVGFPKVLVSTVASGDTSRYVGTSDITMMYSIVDIAGMNSISARILANAAAALAGMVTQPEVRRSDAKPVVTATMFGVTTPAVEAARGRLEDLGYEVLVFHATGAGGRSMEALVSAGLVAGVLDLTTTELADELVGGVFSAGPDRLTAAGRAGVPQVVSFGALDMVNFGPADTVPEQFRSRTLHRHNATVTLMRTTPDECAELGKRIGQRLSAAAGPVEVLIPQRGVSAISVEGGPFHDPEADAALIHGFKSHVDPRVVVAEHDLVINDRRPRPVNEQADHELDRARPATARTTFTDLEPGTRAPPAGFWGVPATRTAGVAGVCCAHAALPEPDDQSVVRLTGVVRCIRDRLFRRDGSARFFWLPNWDRHGRRLMRQSTSALRRSCRPGGYADYGPGSRAAQGIPSA